MKSYVEVYVFSKRRPNGSASGRRIATPRGRRVAFSLEMKELDGLAAEGLDES